MENQAPTLTDRFNGLVQRWKNLSFKQKFNRLATAGIVLSFAVGFASQYQEGTEAIQNASIKAMFGAMVLRIAGGFLPDSLGQKRDQKPSRRFDQHDCSNCHHN